MCRGQKQKSPGTPSYSALHASAANVVLASLAVFPHARHQRWLPVPLGSFLFSTWCRCTVAPSGGSHGLTAPSLRPLMPRGPTLGAVHPAKMHSPFAAHDFTCTPRSRHSAAVKRPPPTSSSGGGSSPG